MAMTAEVGRGNCGDYVKNFHFLLLLLLDYGRYPEAHNVSRETWLDPRAKLNMDIM